MANDNLQSTALVRALADLLSDFSDLVQKELRLARAEIADKVSLKVRGGIWFAAAGVLGFVAALLFLEAVVFAIASAGLAIYWACLIVAACLLILGGIAFFLGRSDVAEDMLPTRSTRQLSKVVNTVKELQT